MRIIGGDSCAGNTGRLNGVFALVDKITGVAHHHFVCALHLNELPLRHLATHYLGRTMGPNTFESDLGKQICNLKNPQIKRFHPIPHSTFPEVPPDVVSGFSQDQKLLYSACTAVISGHCSLELAARQMGPVSHSRWITLALRIIMFYMTFEDAPFEIARLANFVVKHYMKIVPSHFGAKI